MSKKTYPVIGASRKQRDTSQAKCKCGQRATHKVDIQVNIFRGDDEVELACEEHRRDPHFLLGLTKETGGAA